MSQKGTGVDGKFQKKNDGKFQVENWQLPQSYLWLHKQQSPSPYIKESSTEMASNVPCQRSASSSSKEDRNGRVKEKLEIMPDLRQALQECSSCGKIKTLAEVGD